MPLEQQRSPRPVGDTQAFADLVRAETARRGILLIVDEVITLRLGLSGLHGRYGITPDLVTMGKIIGGGFAVGAWGGPADMMGVLDPRRAGNVPHAGTFSANPVTCAAGLAALDLLDQPAIDRINAHGDRLREAVAAMGYNVAGSGSLFRLPTSSATTTPGGGSTAAGILVATNGLCSALDGDDRGRRRGDRGALRRRPRVNGCRARRRRPRAGDPVR